MKITRWSQVKDLWQRTLPVLSREGSPSKLQCLFYETVHKKFPRILEGLRTAERSRKIIEEKNRQIRELEDYIKQLRQKESGDGENT